MFHKIQILPASIQKPIFLNSAITGGGNISQLVYLTPHPSSPTTTQDIAAVNFYR